MGTKAQKTKVRSQDEKKAAKKANRLKAKECMKRAKMPATVVIPLSEEAGGGTIVMNPIISKNGSLGYYGNGKLVVGDRELTCGFQAWIKHSAEEGLAK